MSVLIYGVKIHGRAVFYVLKIIFAILFYKFKVSTSFINSSTSQETIGAQQLRENYDIIVAWLNGNSERNTLRSNGTDTPLFCIH